MKKLRNGEVLKLAQATQAENGENQDANPGNLSPESRLFTTILNSL